MRAGSYAIVRLLRDIADDIERMGDYEDASFEMRREPIHAEKFGLNGASCRYSPRLTDAVFMVRWKTDERFNRSPEAVTGGPELSPLREPLRLPSAKVGAG